MIVREIKQYPEILDKDRFDWFNDYKDTRRWAVRNAPELVSKLDRGYDRYIAKHKTNFNCGYGRRFDEI